MDYYIDGSPPEMMDLPYQYYTMWGPRSIAKLIISLQFHYGLWYANNELVTGANLNQQTSLGGLTL